MTTNDALTTTAAQVETILADHSVTYTTADNRDKEEGGATTGSPSVTSPPTSPRRTTVRLSPPTP